jgi:hypothetical protein
MNFSCDNGQLFCISQYAPQADADRVADIGKVIRYWERRMERTGREDQHVPRLLKQALTGKCSWNHRVIVRAYAVLRTSENSGTTPGIWIHKQPFKKHHENHSVTR